ncbi:MAG: accessory factor UbiK family protein [Kiloniellaceae bacterium]
MQSQSKILEDMAKVASSAMGVAAGMRSEVEARFREQLERLLAQMDVVPREEFDAMKAVAVAAREAQEGLSAQVAALEKRLAALEKAQAAAAKKSAAGKGGPAEGDA